MPCRQVLQQLVQRQEAGAQAGGGGEDADFRMWDDQWQAPPSLCCAAKYAAVSLIV